VDATCAENTWDRSHLPGELKWGARSDREGFPIADLCEDPCGFARYHPVKKWLDDRESNDDDNAREKSTDKSEPKASPTCGTLDVL
jgi:hypothetical protein